MAPLFIIMSFSFGTAVFLLVLAAACHSSGRALGDALLFRLKNLLAVFVSAVLYFVLAYHLTNLYATEHHGFEAFILNFESLYSKLFWIGQVGIGSLVPLALFYSPKTRNCRVSTLVGAGLVIVGGLIQMYVIIIGGQAYPLVLFPGMEESSSFFDGVVASYVPSVWEFLLGITGVAISLILVVAALGSLDILPRRPVGPRTGLLGPIACPAKIAECTCRQAGSPAKDPASPSAFCTR